ncbi:hypothetical protein FB45DRAFT_1036201 [Roridomyces roridus]|uniref:C2H2-type domain-containing protein n=1 Tax=Roridomyces roridus TaxID=1738132 RepID=A0AAD7B8N8_9AGAR|nr:hypothetical protein FB45DRAFT_1036201 [Roridomyces roridus]
MTTAITLHQLAVLSDEALPESISPRSKRDAMFLSPEQIALSLEQALVAAGLKRGHEEQAPTWLVLDDDASTWEFNAPVASWTSDSSTCVSSSSSSPTPAQDLVSRYRSGLKIDLGPGRSSSDSTKANKSCSSSYDHSYDASFLSMETLSTLSSLSIDIPFQDQCNLKPVFRESRANALLDIREEALAVMDMDGLGLDDPIVCHRPDCRDTLPGMRAFMYHLHIHNMHDRLWKCDACNKGYETRRELTMHQCPKLATSLPSSPIRDTFMRVLTKITSRE